ncbi:hypothetical protein FEM03_06385 [Phragmitibacter flavus]|uniref:HTTM domain-containing protein n=2 Tax=Phragmitibacter flavus TaxID=2576071 RepID=A0A5R8KHK6_9BACT|nr:hypothetical protein FEM03_06385 [Phragmitibacter flavus]
MPRWEAILTRCLLAWLLWNALPYAIPPWTSQPHPTGLGHFFDFTWLSTPANYELANLVSRSGIILFALGVLPVFGLCGFLVLDISLHSLASSQGFQGHGAQVNGLLALGLLGGYLWHAAQRWKVWNPLHQPLLFDAGSAAASALQGARIMLAATYVVSGLSKVTKGGIDWPLRGDSFVLQILKAQDEMRATHIHTELTSSAVAFGEFLAAHPALASLMLCGALALELGAFLALLGRRWALAIGIGLLVFHKSNHWLMGLPFKANQWALWFLFIMPLHWLVQIPKSLYYKNKTISDQHAPSLLPIWKRLAKHPVTIALLLAFFLLWRGDWYPFSNFPMYSSLKASTNSLLATDLNGNLIPFQSLGTNAPTVKKMLRTELKLRRDAGEFKSYDDVQPGTYRAAIEKVVAAMMAVPGSEFQSHQAFRIVRKDYVAKDGEVIINSQILGEFPAVTTPPPPQAPAAALP